MGSVHRFAAPPARAQMYCAGVQAPPQREPTVAFLFQLPPALLLRVQPGRWMPTLHGVRLDVAGDGEVTIGGFDLMETYAADQVMEQARQFLDCVVPRAEAATVPETIAAQLVYGSRADRPEHFQIICNARVAIAQRERWHVKPALIA
jgi:hypothetical protein